MNIKILRGKISMIPLMKNAFLNEKETKRHLSDFILKSRQLSMGEQCKTFEKNFAQKQGCKDAVLFNSGGSANYTNGPCSCSYRLFN